MRTTRGNDYYITITESKKRFDGNGYERHKLFIYKEDFNKFAEELQQVIDHIKGLLPDFDFDAFSHKYDEHEQGGDHDHYDDHMEDDNNGNGNDNGNGNGQDTGNHNPPQYDDDLKL